VRRIGTSWSPEAPRQPLIRGLVLEHLVEVAPRARVPPDTSPTTWRVRAPARVAAANAVAQNLSWLAAVLAYSETSRRFTPRSLRSAARRRASG